MAGYKTPGGGRGFALAGLVALLALSALHCRWSGGEVPAELIDQDYYFTGGYVQIQGTATLPPVQETIESRDDAGNTKTVVRYRTLAERRDLCREAAIIDGHAKWLALTDRDWESQAEWTLRLNMGARGRWSGCLDDARLRDTFFDRPDGCRVSLVYPCNPRNY